MQTQHAHIAVSSSDPIDAWFTGREVAAFARDGYLVVRGMADAALAMRMREVANAHVAKEIGPIEYEADTGYPGAPPSRNAHGGRTPRRLLGAYARDAIFRHWATCQAVRARVEQLLGGQAVLSQAHHNCVMTKHPNFSSSTGWHQDIRYWNFTRPELVTVWLALGEERPQTGGLSVLPGSHTAPFSRDRYDDALFFRTDLERNTALLSQARAIELQPGDVVFFHARLLHAAGRNQGDRPKMAVVFTYHATDNAPVPGTRSSSVPDVPLG